MFIAYGQQGLRMASADGHAWSEPVVEKENYYFKGCVHVEGRFVAFATLGGKIAFFESADGTTWKKLSEQETGPDGGRLHDIVYGNDRFLVLGGDMDGNWTSVMTSRDAISWEGPQKFNKEPLLTRVAFGNGKFVAVGVKGRVAVSETGEAWQDAEPLAELDTFIDIRYGAGLFVGSGLHGLRMFSRDALKWEGRVVGQEGEHINSMLWTGDQFVGVGLGATFFSPDGKTWRREPNQNAPESCSYGNGLFVGSAWKGRILTSADALTWEESFRAVEHVNGVAFGKS